MQRRLLVIDGADQGQKFWLPDTGTVLVGNNSRHCDVCLHDLYVGRTHCHLEIDGDRVLVRALDTPAGTLVNGKKVKEHELQLGEVLRAGNSHLRLELAVNEDPPAAAPSPRPSVHPGKVEILSLERFGELSGLMLGHHKIGPILGRGHCGAVFRAHDVKKNEAVALKVFAPTFPANEDELQHFIRVVKQVLPLRHPNLVALHGAGKTGPYVWVSQELIEGESLTAVLANLRTARKIKWRRAWRVAQGLALALEFSRSHHVVHGNLTPQNILLQASDGQVKLNDLFLLKALHGSKLQQTTLENKFLTEMPFWSPEHVDPDIVADDLSDQFSLGTIIYALLTGRPPFEASSPEETLTRIRAALPESPKLLQRSIPTEFQAIVLKMLEKRPENRYPTPAALLADLQQIPAEQEE